jgi:hypothetical protein
MVVLTLIITSEIDTRKSPSISTLDFLSQASAEAHATAVTDAAVDLGLKVTAVITPEAVV